MPTPARPLIAPKPGDPADHLVIDAAGGRFALTVTCAANALGLVGEGEYAGADPESARLAYAAAATALGADLDDLARQHIALAVAELARPIKAAVKTAGADLRRLDIVGVGGGAGALVPSLAAALGRPGSIARNAEILSSIGAATSLIQAVEERTSEHAGADVVRAAIDAAEAAAIAAGASPTMIETTTEFDQERGLIRAIATGSLPLEAGLDIAAARLPEADLAARAASDLGLAPERRRPARLDRPLPRLLGRRGDEPQEDRPTAVGGPRHPRLGHPPGPGADGPHRGAARRSPRMPLVAIRRAERHIGPTSIAPPVVVVRGRRVSDLAPLTGMDALLAAVRAELDTGEPVIIVIEAEGGR